jgi:transcriptional regulator with XRE-family HTH domain
MDTATLRHARLVGANLRERREAAGLSQQQLGLRVERGQQQVSHWESGDHRPSAEHLEALAAVLGCHWTDFYARRDGA